MAKDIVAEKIIKTFENGYTIRQDADLVNTNDGGKVRIDQDFQIVNPAGTKVLIHDEDVAVLTAIIESPVLLERAERKGSIGGL